MKLLAVKTVQRTVEKNYFSERIMLAQEKMYINWL